MRFWEKENLLFVTEWECFKGESQRIEKSSYLHYVSPHCLCMPLCCRQLTYINDTSSRSALYFEPEDYNPIENFTNYWPYQFAMHR